MFEINSRKQLSKIIPNYYSTKYQQNTKIRHIYMLCIKAQITCGYARFLYGFKS
jgi:hypothetical protein